MKKLILGLSILCLLVGVPVAYADGVCDPPGTYCLAVWGFNFDGIVQAGDWPNTPGTPPAGWSANYSGFDFTSGLGTINFQFNSGPGAYNFLVFLDHDIGPFPLDSNTGSPFGAPVPGQTWQLGPPGYPGDGGDTYFMFAANTLKNLNEIDPGEYADVSAALGWAFNLNPGDTASITLSVSTAAPPSGFYLEEFDAVTGSTVDISGTVAITSGAIPEPGTFVLLGSGLLGVSGWLRRRLTS